MKKVVIVGIFLIFLVLSCTLILANEASVESNVRVLSNGDESNESGNGGGGGGGSGHGGVPAAPEPEELGSCIFVDKSFFHVFLEQGTETLSRLTIENRCDKEVDVVVDARQLSRFLKIEETNYIEYVIPVGEKKVVNLVFFADFNEEPDVHTGTLVIAGDKNKDIELIIEVESGETFIAVDLTLNEESKEILDEEFIDYILSIYDLKNQGVNVTIETIIKNMKDEEVYSEIDSVFVKNVEDLQRQIRVANLKTGKYILYVKAEYRDRTVVSSEIFYVRRDNIPIYWILGGAIALLIAIFVITKVALRKRRVIVIHKKKYQHDSEYRDIYPKKKKIKKKKIKLKR